MAECVLYEMDGDVAIVTLNRPEILNPVNAQLADEFIEAMRRANGDPAVKAVVLTGAGERAFSSGQDLAMSAELGEETIGDWSTRMGELYQSVRALDKPSVVALNGLAAGFGLQVALHADIRVGHPEVRMAQPEINAGLPSVIGNWVMNQIVGHGRMVDMALSGRFIDAEQCLAWGLINYVVPRDQVMAKALEIARDLAAKPPMALLLTKRRIRELTQPGYDETIARAKAYQRQAYASGEPQRVAVAFKAERRARRGKA